MATPGYLDTMGIQLVAGHDFANEAADAAVKSAVVNQALVDQFFPGQDAVGRIIHDGDVKYQIIGVVKNIKSRTLGEDTRLVLFRSLAQSTANDPSGLGYTLLVRTNGSANEALLTNAVREKIHAIDPPMAIYNVETMPEHLRSALFLPRLAGTLFGIFGAIGIVLAAVGLYGLMSYSVGTRVKEIVHSYRAGRAAWRGSADGGRSRDAAHLDRARDWNAGGVGDGENVGELLVRSAAARRADVYSGAARRWDSSRHWRAGFRRAACQTSTYNRRCAQSNPDRDACSQQASDRAAARSSTEGAVRCGPVRPRTEKLETCDGMSSVASLCARMTFARKTTGLRACRTPSTTPVGARQSPRHDSFSRREIQSARLATRPASCLPTDETRERTNSRPRSRADTPSRSARAMNAAGSVARARGAPRR